MVNGPHMMAFVWFISCLSILLSGCGDRDLRTGRYALGHGQYKLAVKHLEKAKKRGKTDPGLKRDLASAHRSLAMGSINEGHCELAQTHIKAAEAMTHAVRADHEGLFRCIQDNETASSLKESILSDLIERGDTRAVVLRALLDVLFERGKDAEAMTLAPGLQARFALKASDHRRLGFAFAKAEKFKEAHPHLVRAVWTNPTDPLIRLRLAETLEAMEQFPEAGRVYRALTKDFPTNPVVFLRLAAYWNRRGDSTRAARALQDANRLRKVRRPQRQMRPLLPSKR